MMNKIIFADGTQLNKYEVKIILVLLTGRPYQVIEIAGLWKDTNLAKYTSACQNLIEKGFLSSRTRKGKRKYAIRIPAIVKTSLSDINLFVTEKQMKEAEARLECLIKDHFRYTLFQKIETIGFWYGGVKNSPIGIFRELLRQIFDAVFEIRLKGEKTPTLPKKELEKIEKELGLGSVKS